MAKKRKSNYRKFTIIMLLFVGGLMLYLLFGKFSYLFNGDRESNFTIYPGFGIAIPNGYTIHGIDVSRYQKRVNWPVVKQMSDNEARIGFAFIKATEGMTLTDGQFKRNWARLRQNKVPRGAYHYMNSRGSGKKQAEHFIKVVDLLPGDLPPVLDVETLNGTNAAKMQQFVAEWLQTVEAHYGVKPIIYTNAAFYNAYLDKQFSDYPLWVAHYLERHEPRVKRHWDFWQHNEGGRVNGIDAFVDFNVFNGDSADFRAMLIP